MKSRKLQTATAENSALKKSRGRFGLPSPALIVALLALVFSMTGYAAAQFVPLDPPNQKRVSEAGTGSAVALCPPGFILTGGGGHAGGITGDTRAPLNGTRPTIEGQAWVATVTDRNAPVIAYAMCKLP